MMCAEKGCRADRADAAEFHFTSPQISASVSMITSVGHRCPVSVLFRQVRSRILIPNEAGIKIELMNHTLEINSSASSYCSGNHHAFCLNIRSRRGNPPSCGSEPVAALQSTSSIKQPSLSEDVLRLAPVAASGMPLSLMATSCTATVGPLDNRGSVRRSLFSDTYTDHAQSQFGIQ